MNCSRDKTIMTNHPQVYLDQDGVLAGFIAGICAAHHRPDPYVQPHAKGIWDVWTLWEMSMSDFWKPCDMSFWHQLPKTPEADSLMTTSRIARSGQGTVDMRYWSQGLGMCDGGWQIRSWKWSGRAWRRGFIGLGRGGRRNPKSAKWRIFSKCATSLLFIGLPSEMLQ